MLCYSDEMLCPVQVSRAHPVSAGRGNDIEQGTFTQIAVFRFA